MLCLFAMAGCGQKTGPPAKLSIEFTCDVDGRLEPCGCFTGQFGGLTRLKTVLDSEPDNGQTLRVDVGNAIAGHEDFQRIEYNYILRAFAAMKFEVLNIGAREAQLSAAELREIKNTSPVPIVSANVLDKNTGKPIFDSYRIIERGGFRIAVIGVLDASGERDSGDGVAVGDMDSAVARCIEQVRPKADVIVLLAFADEAALDRLAQEFYEANVILGGKVRQPAQSLEKNNRSLIYYVTNESRALGILQLQLAHGAAPVAVANEIELLHDKIPQAPEFQKLAQQYRGEIRRTPLALDNPNLLQADAIPGVRTTANYVGSETCVKCHQTAGEIWEHSAHAHAFDALVQRGADADPNCISCHTIGFGTSSGYRREFTGQKLVNVGCESCHGPGSLHVRQKEGDASIAFMFRPLDAGDCRKCHFGEFSRPFDWNEFWPLIQHGKEIKSTTATLQ